MTLRRICVYALALPSAVGLLATNRTANADEPVPNTSSVALLPQAATTLSDLAPRSNDLWWALIKIHVEMVCAVLDCESADLLNPHANLNPEDVKTTMRNQITAYGTSGVLQGLSTETIAQAQAAIASIEEAFLSPPPELDGDLVVSYPDMLKDLSDDLAAQ